MEDLEVINSLIDAIRDEVENLKSMDKIEDILVDYISFRREEHSTIYGFTVELKINIKRGEEQCSS